MQPTPVQPKNPYQGMDIGAVNLAKAIRQRESGGNFDAVGDNGTSGGAYQWQAPTWKAHAKQVLGDENAKMTRENQNAVAYGVIKQWKDEGLNVADIAARWNSGSEKGWENKVGTNMTGGKPLKYDVPAYVKGVTEEYQRFKAETPQYEEATNTETVSQEMPLIAPTQDQRIENVKSVIPKITDVPVIGNVVNSATEGVRKIGTGLSDLFGSIGNSDINTSEGLNANVQKGLRGGLAAASGALETVFSPITGAMKSAGNLPGIKQAIGAVNDNIVRPAVDAISGNRSLQKFAMSNPNAEQVTGDLINVAGAFVGGKKAPSIKGALTDAAETGSNLSSTVLRKAQEMTSKSEKTIENQIISSYEKSVKPNLGGKSNPTQAKAYKNDIVNGINTIKENQSALRFTDEAGNIVEGQAPKNLQQLTEAVDQTKKSIFNKYDTLAKESGESGARISLDKIANELDTIIENKALALTNPETIQFAKDLQGRFKSQGELDAMTAQEVIQNYNEKLKNFYRNPNAENTSKIAIESLIVNNMRTALDDAITGIKGPGYSQLKRQYGSLKSLEKDIVKATLRDSRKNVKGLIDFTDIFSGGQLTSGILTANPSLITSGLTQKAIAAFYKHLNDPNRGVKSLFGDATKLAEKRARAAESIAKNKASVSEKYTINNKPLSKTAETWIDANIDDLNESVLKKLSETSPRVYKEVREYLTSQNYLKEEGIFQRIKNTPNKKGGFIRNPLSKSLNKELNSASSFEPSAIKAKNIHPEDVEQIDTFITKARLGEDISDKLFSSIEKLAEKWNISMDLGLRKVADKLEDILSGKKKVTGTLVPGSLK